MQVDQINESMISADVLIEKAQAGDEQSFNQLLSLWYKRIYNYSLKQCSHDELAADITQRTFIAVFKNLPKLKEIKAFKSWIYRIATNYCHEEGRKIAKGKTVPFTITRNDDGDTIIAEEGEAQGIFFNPEMSFRQLELENILFGCLQSIPKDQRTVIIMKEYEGMKFREIAEVLDTSENTVKTWLYRGLRLLKVKLEERNITKETLSYEL
ncbi:RNA polymerase sigma factor [Ekhidna sp.]|jgi:RNA polymerase sigma factor (sigma-70 family)|uniref:RNA polymerase sigma factor n=1 Tax=Ekhidna sp. TaxID=2608089 RepID=UPI0032EFC0E2